MKTSVSIIMPCYEEVKCLEKLLPQIFEILSNSYETTVLVVNDFGMPDAETENVCRKYSTNIINVPYNMGSQEAILYGIRYEVQNIKSDLILTMDSDGQDDVREIKTLLESVAENEISVAQRVGKRPEGKIFGGFYFIYKKIFYYLTGIMPDFGNFAAYKRDIALHISCSPHFSITYSLALPLIAEIKRIPVKRLERIASNSRVGYHGLFVHGIRSIFPHLIKVSLRLAKIACIPMLLSIILVLVSFVMHIFVPQYAFPHWITTILFGAAIVSTQLLIVCLILFTTAILTRQMSSHIKRYE